MTGINFAALVREYTQTNSSTLPDSKIVLLGNAQKDSFFAPKIFEVKEDAFVVPATTNLEEDQREYAFIDDIIGSITRVEAKFEPTGKYIIVDELNINAHRVPEEEDQITAAFSNNEGEAKYTIRRGSIFIYSGSIVDVTNGLKVFFNTFPQDLTTAMLASSNQLSLATSNTDVVIARMFHELWARSISIYWKSNRDKPIPLTETELNFKNDFEDLLSIFRMGNTDRNLHASLPPDRHLQY